MAKLSLTGKVLREVERFEQTLNDYNESFSELDSDNEYFIINPAHSAVLRASLDLSRLLVKWRQTPSNGVHPK